MRVTRNKGGAPRKEIKMDKNIKFSCTPEVYNFLVEQSKRAGYSTKKRTNVAIFLREFLISMIENGNYTIVKPSEVSREMLLQLISVGSNLNQAMHAMNTFNTEIDLVNLVHQVTATRKILCAIAESITSPHKLQKSFDGEEL